MAKLKIGKAVTEVSDIKIDDVEAKTIEVSTQLVEGAPTVNSIKVGETDYNLPQGSTPTAPSFKVEDVNGNITSTGTNELTWQSNEVVEPGAIFSIHYWSELSQWDSDTLIFILTREEIKSSLMLGADNTTEDGIVINLQSFIANTDNGDGKLHLSFGNITQAAKFSPDDDSIEVKRISLQ